MEFDFIHTYSGNELTFLSPKPEQIEFEDIANNLANNCRYSGNINRFYSVAEHSVILAEKVLELGGSKEEALTALMHDASEAYLCDIPRPMKPHLVGYIEIEAKLQKVIFDKFDIEPMTLRVEYLDFNIVADEAKVLFNSTPDWVNYYEPIGVDIVGLSPTEAKALFIETYNKLNS